MDNPLKFDHVAIPVPPHIPLERFRDLFGRIGFHEEWYRKEIGDGKTGMETSVMTRDGVKFALMRGIDGPGRAGNRIASQVNEYFRQFGAAPQHIALRCDDIEQEVEQWQKAGVRFLTADENGRPQILTDEDDGDRVFQCFTYPLWGSMFFELKQIVREGQTLKKFAEFRDANVEGLWVALDRALSEGWLFNTDIFGDHVHDRLPKPPRLPKSAFGRTFQDQ